MSPRGDAEIHADKSAHGPRAVKGRRLDCGSLGEMVLPGTDLPGDWGDVCAQRDHLAEQGSGAAQDAEPKHGADEHEPALAAPDSANQLYRPGDHGIRAEVPELMDRRGVGDRSAEHTS